MTLHSNTDSSPVSTLADRTYGERFSTFDMKAERSVRPPWVASGQYFPRVQFDDAALEGRQSVIPSHRSQICAVGSTSSGGF